MFGLRSLLFVLVTVAFAGCSDSSTSTPQDGATKDSAKGESVVVKDSAVQTDTVITDTAVDTTTKEDTVSQGDGAPQEDTVFKVDSPQTFDGTPADSAPQEASFFTDTGIACFSQPCAADTAGNCNCAWNCTNGKSYKIDCKPGDAGGNKHCSCSVNGSVSGNCVSSYMSTQACTPKYNCCGFPH